MTADATKQLVEALRDPAVKSPVRRLKERRAAADTIERLQSRLQEAERVIDELHRLSLVIDSSVRFAERGERNRDEVVALCFSARAFRGES